MELGAARSEFLYATPHVQPFWIAIRCLRILASQRKYPARLPLHRTTIAATRPFFIHEAIRAGQKIQPRPIQPPSHPSLPATSQILPKEAPSLATQPIAPSHFGAQSTPENFASKNRKREVQTVLIQRIRSKWPRIFATTRCEVDGCPLLNFE